MKLALAATLTGLILVGCHSTFKADGTEGGAELNVGKDGLTLKSDDGKGGSATINVGSAKVDVHDDKGGFQMEAGPDTFKMKAHGEDGAVENNVSVTASQLTIPIYPDSKEVPIASMRASNKSEDVFISTRTTPDAAEDVISYYKDMLTGVSTTTTDTNGHKKFEVKGKAKSGREIGISAERSEDNRLTTVVIASANKLSKE